MIQKVRITQEDVPLVQEIFDALTKALKSLSEALTKNNKFEILAMTAVINMACRLAQTAGVPRDEFIRTNVKIWDDRATVASKERTWN